MKFCINKLPSPNLRFIANMPIRLGGRKVYNFCQVYWVVRARKSFAKIPTAVNNVA